MNDNHLCYWVVSGVFHFRDSHHGIYGSEPLNGRSIDTVLAKISKIYNVTSSEQVQ